MTTGIGPAVPALTPPEVVVAGTAPRRVAGLPVRAAAFASPAAGWVLVGGPMQCRLLYTEDRGGTWTCQLGWRGEHYGAVAAFDAGRAGLALGLWPTVSVELNGRPVGSGDHPRTLLVGTEDGGATWTVASPPDRQGYFVHFLAPRHIWLVIGVPGAYPRSDLCRTDDGGATWSRTEGPSDMPVVRVSFSSVTDGLLVAADRRLRVTLRRIE
jgi:hypothetical protein